MIDFTIPQELIAQEPSHPRDSAKLLVYNRQTGELTNAVFRDIDNFLPENTTIVVNNSKVEQCRWLFDEGKTELFVLEKLDTHTVRAKVRPGRKFKLGAIVALTEFLSIEVLSIDGEGIRTLRLNIQHDDDRLKKFEHVPLPPYIAQNDELADEYQTVYADPLGSKAAPTAGLHFTDDLINNLKQKHDWLELTLHVGLGTFASLTEENFKTNSLHAETYEIHPDIANKIKDASHVTAVGTTSSRTLESWASSGELSGSTDIFIQPSYTFKRVNSLITNFHLPNTSLLLMVEAFIGSASEMQKIYDYAIAQKYRFYSFGDAMLII